MADEVEVQLHLWPWSAGDPRRWQQDDEGETVDLIDGTASFPYYGSPVISVSSQAELYLSSRHERFAAYGPSFKIGKENYQLHEVPHGILTGIKEGDDPLGYIWIRSPFGRERIRLKPEGTRAYSNINEERSKTTDLYGAVLSWSQQFEILIEMSRELGLNDKLPWNNVLDHFLKGVDKRDEPRMALIVKIAEDMSNKLSKIVNAARKILLRERAMVPGSQVAELDTRCLRWLSRQQGKTLAEKAALNKQRLLGLVRKESFDTFENRILKDFLARCTSASASYLDMEVGDNEIFQKSQRAQKVRSFRHICTMLHSVSHLQDVLPPPSFPRPNYVLQNDFRYRQIWRNYIRLLRKEEEQDRLWDWQGRTWADVVRLMVCITLYKQSQNTLVCKDEMIKIDEIMVSGVHLLSEQKLGCRIMPGCEPGPFMVNVNGGGPAKASILEIVHPDHAHLHPITKDFGLLGGHLYIVVTPLAGKRKTVIIIWAVHTAGAKEHPSWDDIGESAGRALQRQEILLGRKPNLPHLKGFIAASDLKTEESDIHPGKNKGLHLIQIAADPRNWPDALEGMELAVDDVLREIS